MKRNLGGLGISIFALCLFVVVPASAQTVSVVVTSTGVGVGTTAPQDSLEVYKNAGMSAIDVNNPNTTSTAYRGIQLLEGTTRKAYLFSLGSANSTDANALYLCNSANAPTVFHTNDIERMRISGSGKVGIGTANPGSALEIRAPSGVTPFYALGASSNAWFQLGTAQALYLDSEAISPATAASPIQNSPLLAMRGNYWTGSTYQNVDADIWNVVTGSGHYYLGFRTNNADQMALTETGNLGIGTTTPNYKLHVAGQIRASSVITDGNTYADFVFSPDYKLQTLNEVETAIRRDGHLPDIPSAAEAKEHGIDMGQMQVKLLQKVEELTLYVIDLKKENAALRQDSEKLKQRLSAVEAK